MPTFKNRKDKDGFFPDYSPIEMFELGIFEGNYFNKSLNLPSIYSLRLPSKFLTKVNKSKLFTNRPTPLNNFYNISCGQDYESWKTNGWLRDQDPYGWVNWYIQYYYGRRSKDDKRQIGRWKSFRARHKGMLKLFPNSNKIKQSLLHWGIDHTK